MIKYLTDTIHLMNFNSLGGKYEVHKSYRHANGELCFGGGWLIFPPVK